MKYRPPSIQEVGLEKHLNQSRLEHNGFGYDEFVKLCDTGVNPTNIARAMGADPRTVIKWIQLYNQDKTNATA